MVDVAGKRDAIVAAITHARSAEFRQTLSGLRNPYGDGDAARTIARVLTTCPLGDKLLVKKALPLNENDIPGFTQIPTPDSSCRKK